MSALICASRRGVRLERRAARGSRRPAASRRCRPSRCANTGRRSAPGRSRSRRSGRRSAARAARHQPQRHRHGGAKDQGGSEGANRHHGNSRGRMRARVPSAQAPDSQGPMAAYLIRRLWQMIPTLAGVVLLVFFLFQASAATRPRSSAAVGLARADRGDPPAARPRQALVDAAGHLPQADRHLRLGPQLGHQRRWPTCSPRACRPR